MEHFNTVTLSSQHVAVWPVLTNITTFKIVSKTESNKIPFNEYLKQESKDKDTNFESDPGVWLAMIWANQRLNSYLDLALFDYERVMVNILKEQMARCYKDLFKISFKNHFKNRFKSMTRTEWILVMSHNLWLTNYGSFCKQPTSETKKAKTRRILHDNVVWYRFLLELKCCIEKNFQMFYCIFSKFLIKEVIKETCSVKSFSAGIKLFV